MPTIEIRLDVTGIPHSFLVLNNGAGIDQGYGFAPAAAGQAVGDGKVYNDIDHPFDLSTNKMSL